MKQIAFVVSTVGYHWEEVLDAFEAFTKSGCAVSFFTVDGKHPVPDPYSVKRTGPGSWLGLGVPSSIAPTTSRGKTLVDELRQAKSLAHLHPAEIDGLYLPGGHGCLFDVNRNEDLHFIIAKLYERGTVLSGVCHGTSTYAFVQHNGQPIVRGHKLTGFPKALDEALIRMGAVHKRFLPLPFHNDDALRDAGAELTRADKLKATLLPTYMHVSLPFITGVGPKAAWRVAARTARELYQSERREPQTARPVAQQQDAPA